MTNLEHPICLLFVTVHFTASLKSLVKVKMFLCTSVIESNRNLDTIQSAVVVIYLFSLNAYCATEDRRNLPALELESECSETE